MLKQSDDLSYTTLQPLGDVVTELMGSSNESNIAFRQR